MKRTYEITTEEKLFSPRERTYTPIDKVEKRPKITPEKFFERAVSTFRIADLFLQRTEIDPSVDIKPVSKPPFLEKLTQIPAKIIDKIKETPERIKWEMIMTLPSEKRNEYIKKNPQRVIDFVDDYEKIVGPFVRTMYATKIPLAIAEKIVGRQLAATYEELKEKNPLATAVSGLLGDIWNITALYSLTGGIQPRVAAKIPGWAKVSFPFASNYIPKAITAGTTWGARGFLDELTDQFQKGEYSIEKIATESGKEFLFGTLLAAPLAMPTRFLQISGMGAMRGGWTTVESLLRDGTLDGDDALNIGANTILGLVFGALGAKSRVRELHEQRMHDIYRQSIIVKHGEKAAGLVENVSLMNYIARLYPELGMSRLTQIAGKIQKEGGRLTPDMIARVMKPQVILDQQIKHNLPQNIKDFSKLGVSDQMRLFDKITGKTEELAGQGFPFIDSLIRGMQEVFPTVELPETSLTIKRIDPVVPEVPIIPKEFQLEQNALFNEVINKVNAQGVESLHREEIGVLEQGPIEIITEEGVKQVKETDIESEKILELYAGIPLSQITRLPVSIRGTKRQLLDAFGSFFLKYHGLTPGTKKVLIEMEGKSDLRKSDLIKFFTESFPITKEQAKILTSHQENPEDFPIPDELKSYALTVRGLMEVSRRLQAERNLQKEFFPESFINRAYKEIEQHREVLSRLVEEKAINKHKQEIEDIKDYIDFLGKLNYVPHAYLQTEEIHRNILRLLPEGKITAKFRDTLTRLKGRKFATIEDAKEAGLLPEEDIRVLLASHFEYLFRKIATHDIVENLKTNKTAILPEREAPAEWEKVAISQLDGYKVNPFLVDYIEDFSVNKDNFIAKGYDTVNSIGKAIFFNNPLIMPFWNIFQGVAAGAVRPWAPMAGALLGGAVGNVPGALIGTWLGGMMDPRNLRSFKEVIRKGPTYRRLVEGGLYSTPEEGRFSSSMEETMRVIIDRTEDSYPGWKKNIETILGHKINWKTFTVVPELYNVNWKFTWFLDRVQRTTTFNYAIDKGMTEDDAIRYANNFHANYNIFTKKAKKHLNRAFLVPTYKVNMMVNLPSYLAKNTGSLAKKIATGQQGTPEEKTSLMSIFRILGLGAGILSFAAYNGYYLREGYRLVKKLDNPEIGPDGKLLTEKVITLPGPIFEIPKMYSRIKTMGAEGFYMYMAKVPQIAWGLSRNRRWEGSKYYEEAAHPDVRLRTTILGILKDYVAPYGQYDVMTREEQDALDNIMGLFGMATYKRGSTEQRIFFQIQQKQRELSNYLTKPNINWEDKEKAINHFEAEIDKLIEELESFVELF